MGRTNQDTVRVLQVCGRMNRGGAETWLMHVLRHIDRERFHIDFLVHTTERSEFDDEIRALGSELIPCMHFRRPLEYARNFSRIMRERGPYDVVHSHLLYFSGYALFLSRRAGVRKRMAHSHSSSCISQGTSWKRMYQRMMTSLIRQNATDGLAASGKAAECLFGPGWNADPRFRILHCGIDLTPFRASVDSTAVRAGLGIPTDAFVIGHVGRFTEVKNHAMLVDIAAEVSERVPKTYVLLVGDGPLRPLVERQAAQVGLGDRVVFAGIRTDVPRLMLGAMDVFVLPSFYEGLPLVGMEAQAAGLPLILSDVVTQELDEIKPLIRRVSLSQPASAWAEAILASRHIKPPVTRTEALARMQESSFNIMYGVNRIGKIYAGDHE